MKQYVMERDLPQCKQFIKDFVEEVVVYKDHVEVKFSMAFLNLKIKEIYVTSDSKKRSHILDEML